MRTRCDTRRDRERLVDARPDRRPAKIVSGKPEPRAGRPAFLEPSESFSMAQIVLWECTLVEMDT